MSVVSINTNIVDFYFNLHYVCDLANQDCEFLKYVSATSTIYAEYVSGRVDSKSSSR